MVFEKLFMKILNKERKPKQISILIIGLNNSGKSTIVNFFKNKDDRRHISVPTVGFNIEHFESESDFFP
jgi:ADP-ribosylation factor-like protein 6